jgi:biopolymer transport protein ExbD
MVHQKVASMEGGSEVNLSLIITPFLDFAFQLLAFFIMTYNPSALEGHIDGTLVPPSEIASKSDKPIALATDLPPDSDPDLAEAVLVKVKAVAKGQQENKRFDGQPSRIMLKRPEDANDVTISDSDVSLEDGLKKLEEELKVILKQAATMKPNVKLEGDSDLKHVYVMQVYDVCKKAGFKNIAFVAPKFERKKSD